MCIATNGASSGKYKMAYEPRKLQIFTLCSSEKVPGAISCQKYYEAGENYFSNSRCMKN